MPPSFIAKRFARFAELIPAAGRVILEKAPILAGLAIVENGYDETMLLQAVHPNDFEAEDARLLTIARGEHAPDSLRRL